MTSVARKRKGPAWDAESVRGLRKHMALTQEELADELGVRQQTVSEWETGAHRPRGASGRLLTLVADRAEFAYDPGPPAAASAPADGGGAEA
jgi:DNA-binding transcriptional regulator YiaG